MDVSQDPEELEDDDDRSLGFAVILVVLVFALCLETRDLLERLWRNPPD
jgi:hypothetical protein